MISLADQQLAATDYFIDAHSHAWTQATAHNSEHADPKEFPVEMLLQLGGSIGVRKAVLIAHNSIYGYDNSYLIHCAFQLPGRLSVVAMLDTDNLEPANIVSDMWALCNSYVAGFRIERGSRAKGTPEWLAAPGMHAMWATAASTRQAVCAMMHPEDIANLSAMCAKYPDTTVVVDHLSSVGENARFGGTGKLDEADVSALLGLAKFSNVHIKLSAFYALGTG
eukprot:SAG31_NODE_6461_length_2008_cov_2.155579_2_plen_223_part_00